MLLPAQSIQHRGEVWGGYISSIRLNEKLSLWNDFHFVATSFFVSRHGLTYAPRPNIAITGGYAWVATATSFSDRLIRNEHRPWGQVVWRPAVAGKIGYQFRFRYDARWRQDVAGGEVLNGRIFYSRLRLMARLRWPLRELPEGQQIHFDLMDEYLFNAGTQVRNGMDQNRLYLLLGYSKTKLSILGGYHWRAIPGPGRDFTFRHGCTVWVIHRI